MMSAARKPIDIFADVLFMYGLDPEDIQDAAEDLIAAHEAEGWRFVWVPDDMAEYAQAHAIAA